MTKQRTIIVSGGLGGIGRAICTRLASDGFRVVALYHHTKDSDAEEFVRSLPSVGHTAVRCDIRDEQAVRAVLVRCAEGGELIYGCVHAAVDRILRKDVTELTVDELVDQLGVALVGGFNVIQATLPYVRQNPHGRVIALLSRYQFEKSAHKRMASYVIAKYALGGLLSELSLELAHSGVTVNAVAPGFIDTPLSADLPETVVRFIQERSLSGSMKTPEDVAAAIAFLCSSPADAITGKVFSLDESEVRTL